MYCMCVLLMYCVIFTESLSSCDSLPTDSQVMTVTYDDPQAREERQKLLAKIRQSVFVLY